MSLEWGGGAEDRWYLRVCTSLDVASAAVSGNVDCTTQRAVGCVIAYV
jgi:hypothetical protein